MNTTINACSPLLDLFKTNKDSTWLSNESIELTGSQCLDLIHEKQKIFLKEGVEFGKKNLIFTGRGLDFWIDVMATWGLGAISIPVDHQIEQTMLDYIINKSQPDFSIGCEQNLNLSNVSQINVLNEDLNEDFSKPVAVNVSKGDVASILFTSGTTGEPKGVVLSHDTVHGNAMATVDSFEMSNVSNLFVPIPFRFVSALSHFVATLYNHVGYRGSEKKFLKTELLKTLSSNGCDGFGGSPLQLRWISELAEEYSVKLNWLMASGDNLPSQTIKAIQSAMPDARIVTAYGLTELGGRFCILPPSKTLEKIGSVGKPIKGLNYVILNEDSQSVKHGESGQIFVNGDYLFHGYLNDEEKTKNSMSVHGFATGDMGHTDEDGYLYLSGRSDDVFKSGGLKVSTLPIAALLMGSGQFDDLAVTSKADQTLGQIPVVYYVLKKDREFKKGPLMKAIRAQLPPGHLPREFHPIKKIPRTGSGKVQRKALKELIEDTLI